MFFVFSDNGEKRNFRKNNDRLNSTETLKKQQNSSVKQQMFHVKRRKEKRKKTPHMIRFGETRYKLLSFAER